MSIIEWIKEKTSPEAKLLRLQKEVEKEEAKAKLAEMELPLLKRKKEANKFILARDKAKKEIRDDRMQACKDRLKKMDSGLSGESFKIKSPSDRIFNN